MILTIRWVYEVGTLKCLVCLVVNDVDIFSLT